MNRQLPDFAAPSKGAQYMRSLGFNVFPLIPNGKKPAQKDWQAQSLTFEDGTISSYVTGYGKEGSNFGVHPHEGYFVVDIDNKGEKSGSETWAQLERDNSECMATLTVKTPSGGLHKYFRGEGRNSIGAIGRGIDTRANGGFVVAPGSVIDDRQYEVIDDSEVAEAPDWLISAMAKVPLPVKELVSAVPVDLPGNVDAAVAYLSGADIAVEGENGDINLFKVFAKLKDMGISPASARELVLEHYNPRCEPPWTSEEMDHFEQKLAQGFKTKNPPGIDTPEARLASAQADFEPVLMVTGDFRQALPPLRGKRGDEVHAERIVPCEWIYDGHLAATYLTLVSSAPGVGKSSYEMLKAVSVVTGRSLLGARCEVRKKGPVIVFNGEDSLDKMEASLESIRQAEGIGQEETRDVILMSGDASPIIVAGDLANSVRVNWKTVDRIREAITHYGAVAFFVDPLIETHDVEENSNGKMRAVMSAFRSVAKDTKIAISIAHHMSKAALNEKSDSTSHGLSRGATSIIGACRIAYNLTSMTPADLTKLKISSETRRGYFKAEMTKNNLGPWSSQCEWFRTEGVTIGNGQSVGVARWNAALSTRPEVEELTNSPAVREELELFLEQHLTGRDLLDAKSLNEIALRESRCFAVTTTRTADFAKAVRPLLVGNVRFEIKQDKSSTPWYVQRITSRAAASAAALAALTA